MTQADATVFIVDDDSSVRKSLLRLIRANGWHGEAFASALEFLARKFLDLIEWVDFWN